MDNSFITTSSDSTYQVADPSALGLIISIAIVCIIISIAFYVFSAICLGRIFKKAGKESWPAWVPFYNMWILLELGDQKGYYLLFILIPYVGQFIFVIFECIAMYHIGLKLGKTGAFVLWGIFLYPVWLAWLAFDESKWNNISAPTAPATPVVAN